MKILSIQVALFSPTRIDRPDLVHSEINSKLNNIFDTMPVIMDLPQNAPDELPVVQAKSSDGIYALNVSRGRVDFFVSPKMDNTSSVFDMFKSYKNMIEKYYKSVSNSISLNRVGIICTLFNPADNNTRLIHEKYLSGSFNSGCVESTVRTNIQNLNKEIIYNNIKTVEAVNLKKGDNTEKGVIIILDTNNAVSADKLISNEIIAYVVNLVAGKLKDSALKELI